MGFCNNLENPSPHDSQGNSHSADSALAEKSHSVSQSLRDRRQRTRNSEIDRGENPRRKKNQQKRCWAMERLTLTGCGPVPPPSRAPPTDRRGGRTPLSRGRGGGVAGLVGVTGLPRYRGKPAIPSASRRPGEIHGGERVATGTTIASLGYGRQFEECCTTFLISR
ncbi:unnamed protein product [Nesidiocoris tenuis]|uniref:Uncharacterized protein n=1 Tax=Nesidiocoris tenuis TaxID=355587 RepID=A0A6H5HRE2_9HEMI|nr:unnamed protein product [Nesidiocoris tenuis]